MSDEKLRFILPSQRESYVSGGVWSLSAIRLRTRCTLRESLESYQQLNHPFREEHRTLIRTGERLQRGSIAVGSCGCRRNLRTRAEVFGNNTQSEVFLLLMGDFPPTIDQIFLYEKKSIFLSTGNILFFLCISSHLKSIWFFEVLIF